MKTLKELVLESGVIAQSLIESGGELTPDIESSLTENIAALPSKVDGCQAVLDRLENESDYWKAKADEFYAVSKTISNARERLKDYIKQTMLNNGVKELSGHDIRICLQNSKAKLILDESKVPEIYKRQIVSTVIDKDKISEDLKIGVPVEGASLQEVFALKSYMNKTRKKVASE